MQPLLIVTGPTACGKSEVALRLSGALSGEILNLDSMQIYRGFDIGTAKPSPRERGQVSHHLFDIREPGEDSNVAQYLEAAQAVICDVQGRGRQCVFAGGSTLYLTCLLHGLAPLPAADRAIRAKLERRSSDELYQELLQVDPESLSAIRPEDRLRIIRALEAWNSSGVKPSLTLREHGHKEIRHSGLILVLCWPRESLYTRINARAEKMLADGLLEETRLLSERYGSELFQFKSLGYAQALQCLKGDLSEAKLAEEIAMQTRRFAKRQMTYFRNEPSKRGWTALPGADEGSELEATPERGPGAKMRTFRVMSCGFAELKEKVEHRLAEPFQTSEIWYLAAPALVESVCK